MHNIEKHIIDHWSHLKNVPLFVACSGGLDSMVLLHTFFSLGFDVTALHVNYQLRGEDSELDHQSVESYCRENNIPFDFIIGEIDPTQNLQESAREIRYRWFREKMEQFEGSKTLFAHHADDQIETFFLNLARKSGILGMSCMPSVNGDFIRPFLSFSKKELEAYAIENGILWREDRSNSTSKYRRNFLRNEVLPKLYAKHPELKASILDLVSVFQHTQRELEQSVAPLLKSIEETNQFPVHVFDTLSNEEKFELFRRFGVTGNELRELEKLRNTERGKRLALRNENYAALVKDEDAFTFQKSIQPAFSLVLEEIDELPSSFGKHELYLDQDLIHGTLLLRSPLEGDRISPIGMTGSQLISDILKDAKIDANEKSRALILCDEKAVHWLVGHKIGRKSLATAASKKIVKCTISGESPK